jgi:hypothetical protein
VAYTFNLPPDVIADFDIINFDIAFDSYVGLVRHVLNGHEFEQDVPPRSRC